MRRLLPLRTGVVASAVVLLAVAAVVAVAEETKPAKPAKPATTNSKVTYLGVAVAPLYSPLSDEMPELFGGGQGVLVTSVVPGSPAEKAGIQADDVLMTYGDQKLFSPEELVKLVRADQADHQVTFSLIREGRIEQITATLGKHQVAQATAATPPQAEHHAWSWPEWQSPNWRLPHWFTQPTTSGEKSDQWKSFDSMTIKNLGDNRFQAEIQFLDKEGKMQKQEFKGTRDEIHKAILAQKDLPKTEQQQLLRSLDMPGGVLEIPRLHVVPGHGFTWDFGEADRAL